MGIALGGKLLLVLVAVSMIRMVCGAKVMAADQVAAKAATNGSLNEPSEKDGDVAAASGNPQVQTLQKQVLALQESLALAQAEAELYSQQYKDLRLKNELMGVDALTVDEQRLQDRVVQAVRELYQTEQDRRELVNRLQQMIDASQELLKTVDKVDPQKRADYEVALRSAREVLAGGGHGPVPAASDLHGGQIVHVNTDLNSVILNVGSRLDVRAGMPFQVIRDDRIIGRVQVFQVRDQICAALVQNVEKDVQLRVGDRVQLDVQK
jgi:hypothetical protein